MATNHKMERKPAVNPLRDAFDATLRVKRKSSYHGPRTVRGFRQRLRDLRIAKQMTHEELAIASLAHEDTIYKLESGARSPSFFMAIRLARALGVTPNDLSPEFTPDPT